MPEKEPLDLWSSVSSHEGDTAWDAYCRKNEGVCWTCEKWYEALQDLFGAHNVVDIEGYWVYHRDPKGQPLPWFCREQLRMKNRKIPVWHKEPFWEKHAYVQRRHFVHVCEADPRLLVYTENDEKGNRDIQTRIKPGRYLTKYFQDYLSPKKIKFLAAWQTSGKRLGVDDSPLELMFATTPDEIAKVYIDGPRSCMDGAHFENFENHPARVYGAGDLAIAYLMEDEDKIIARCLVWPEKKAAGRVYPTPDMWRDDGYAAEHESADVQDTLTHKLKLAGYSFLSEEDGTFDGARLLKIPYGSGYLMPYLDNGYMVDDAGDHFVMKEEGRYGCDDADGYISLAGDRCDRCGVSIDEGDYWCVLAFCRPQVYQHWCNDCTENHTFRCEASTDLCSNELTKIELHGGAIVCEGWAIENCYRSDYSGKWFVKTEDAPIEMYDGSVWSFDEFNEHGFKCVVTGHRLPKEHEHPCYPGV